MSSVVDNYFTLLDMPVAAEIDSDLLNRHYFDRQRQCHPDNVASKPAEERQRAMYLAMQLNDAYSTLKNPLKRAEYLLLLKGIRVNTETDGVKPSPQLLMEAMEVRERLLEATGSEALKALENEAAQNSPQLFQQFATLYDAGKLDEAAQKAIQMKYNEKLQEEIKAKRRTHAAT